MIEDAGKRKSDNQSLNDRLREIKSEEGWVVSQQSKERKFFSQPILSSSEQLKFIFFRIYYESF